MTIDQPRPVFLVTGAGSGIGQATAARLGQSGGAVVAADRDPARLGELVHTIEAAGGAATACVADVSVSGDVQRYVRTTVDTYGRIDGFFNSAGVTGPITEIVDYDETSFDQVIAVNLRGVFLGLKHVLPVMYEQGSGSIVNAASVAGLVGHLAHGGYVASKHAVVGLTKVAGAEAAPHGVRVNAVAPGPTDTPMMASIEAMKSPGEAEVERSRLLDNIPAHRYASVDDIAAAVEFLLRGDSSYLNGSVLTVDGGFTAIR